MFFFVPDANYFVVLGSFHFAYNLLGKALDRVNSVQVYDYYKITYLVVYLISLRRFFRKMDCTLTMTTCQGAVRSTTQISDSPVFPASL